MLELTLAVVGTIWGVAWLNRKYPLDDVFEVSNLIGRIIAVSIPMAAIAMLVSRIRN